MSIEFYIPRQGDTAGTVTDGYAANFEALDAAKADKAAGKDLMTDAEREKLAGIEAQANRYIHPDVHPADMIADTPAKVVMTAEERDKLARVEPGANAYTLPAASADTLGGVKAGRNLKVDPDGTLHAPSPAGVEPDAVPALGQVAASDRLLAFNESGEPVTATAGKLREFAAEGLATADAVNAALDGKFDKAGGDLNGELFIMGDSSYRDDGKARFGRDANGAFFDNNNSAGVTTSQLRLRNDGRITFWKPEYGNNFCDIWHAGNFDPATKASVNHNHGEQYMQTATVYDANAVHTNTCGFGWAVPNAPVGGDALFLNVTTTHNDYRHGMQFASDLLNNLWYRTRYLHNYDDSKKDEGWRDWVKIYHSGNLNPDSYIQYKGQRVDISQPMLGTGFQYDTGGSGTAGPFISAGSPGYPLQLVCGYWGGNGGHHNLKFRTYNGDSSSWNPWHTVYCDANLTPATAASVGLMSAEDKIKLNSVASAMSLSVGDAPATMSLEDGEIPQEPKVDPRVQIRAQRSAQYQMQSDELLYDALETFARSHPEYTEFAAWLQAKDRIRQELPAPENGPAR